MKDFVAKLLSKDAVSAKSILGERIKSLVDEKLNQLKMRVAMELFEDIGTEVELVESFGTVRRSSITKMGRTKVIRVRVRQGKIQRRIKKSAIKGYTVRGGKLVRMSPAEKRHRQLAVRRSKFKRRAKLKIALRKRRMSLRKRGAMGI